MMRLGLLASPLLLALWLFCVIDVILTRDDEPRHLPKVGWLLLVLFFPLVGSIAWLVVGRPRKPKQSPYGPATAFPEYDRPGRAAAVDPNADAEFLRQVRERAEEQRRRYREQQAERAAAEASADPAVPEEPSVEQPDEDASPT
ncbi:PLDc N-terminal domain-containing protein [Nocardioides limicola]|uniref:PLDc N-terminal domain-containing protein n=1 Tax=Nocardioides limicola TaxID=2803368 RepID=UPI00193C4CB4|nr:PLDc N-terminal domain-containing protein [Nocardioides sp. DJM-14]